MLKKIYNNKYFYPVLFIAGLWFVAIVLVNPIGDFPLNDDWAYGKNVYNLTEKGTIQFSDWPAMSLIAHVLWGALFCKLFGFSFTILRISILILSMFGIIAIYSISFQLSKNTILSLLVTLTIAFNPLFFSLSYTYMTDTSFLSVIMLSLLFYIKYLKTEKFIHLIIAVIFTVLSILIRQIGLLLSIAFAISFIIKSKFSLKSFILTVSIILISFLSLYFYEQWLDKIQNVPSHYSTIKDLFPKNFSSLIRKIFKRTGIILFYCGLFLSPVVLFFSYKILISNSIKTNVFTIALSIPFIYTFIKAWKHVPIWNIFYNLGLGPKLLKDTYWGDNLSPQLSNTNMEMIKIFAFISAFFLVFIFINNLWQILKIKQNNYSKHIKLMLVVSIFLYFGFIILNNHYFDRYNLLFFPLLIFFFIFEKELKINSIVKIISFVILLFMSVFSIFATKDYLSWNRSRWKALDYLTTEMEILPTYIDGGFEFNGWHKHSDRSPESKNLKSWWFVDKDDYVISFGEICGFSKVKSFSYKKYLPLKQDSIFILKKRITPLFVISCDLETLSKDNKWFLSNNNNDKLNGIKTRSKDKAKSGEYSVKLNEKNPFALKITFDKLNKCEKYEVFVWRHAKNSEAGIVCFFKGSTKKHLFSNSNIIEKDSAGWELLKNEITIPKNCSDCFLEIYLWNPKGKDAWFDDMTIKKY